MEFQDDAGEVQTDTILSKNCSFC